MSDSFNTVLLEQADQTQSPKVGVRAGCTTSDGPYAGTTFCGWKTSNHDGDATSDAQITEGPTGRVTVAAARVLLEQADQTQSPKLGTRAGYTVSPVREEGAALPCIANIDRFGNAISQQKRRCVQVS